ncbi:hypothetical protein [Microbacterium sp. Mcb102]|uniref:hypothetical protein n=1 Tax=Microbacterium sp. Mcb102 TaxID=2926012 RepID=UPI0021C7903D|nr:hypothetical protein [Microbacterium sp. Mcb102]
MHTAPPGSTPLSRTVTEPWVQVALSARVMQQTLRSVPEVRSGAYLDVLRRFLPQEPVDVWCRGFLEASLEHLVMWADYATPLKYHPEASVEFTLRPAQTLARAALESAAQAVWILSAADFRDAARRHAALVLADWDEQRKAALDDATKAGLKRRSESLREGLGFTDNETRPPTYLTLVRDASAHVREQLPAALLGSDDAVERLWRASAGSAHGKQWPASELVVVNPSTGSTMPDPAAITAILKLADAVVTYGVMRFADRSGYAAELSSIQQSALAQVYAKIPLLPGAPSSPPSR